MRATRFGGELTPILSDSLHPSSFVTGAVVVAAFGAVGFVTLQLGIPEVLASLWMAISSLVVVRVAVNAAYGDPRGRLLDASGGPWPTVVVRTVRLIGLNLVWAVPLGFVGSRFAAAIAGQDPGSMPPGPAVLLVFVAAALPPLNLVLAVAAGSFVEALSPSTWAATFGGRKRELLSMFAVFVGGCSAMFVGAGLLAVGFGLNNRGLFVFVLLTGMAWALGSVHLLLGRLVGGFLRTAGEDAGFAVDPGAGDPLGDDPFPFDGPADDGLDDGFVHVQVERGEVQPTRMADPNSLLDRLRANEHIEDDDLYLAYDDAVQMESTFGPRTQILARVAILAHRLEHAGSIESAGRAAEAARKAGNVGVLADLYEAFGDDADFGGDAPELARCAESLATRDHHDAAIELYARALDADPSALSTVKSMIQWAERLLRRDASIDTGQRVFDVLEQHRPDHPFTDFVADARQDAARKLDRVGH